MSNQTPTVIPVHEASILHTWINALTKPRAATYALIAASPRAKAGTAYLWIFLCSAAASLITLTLRGAAIRSQLTQAGSGLEQFGGGFDSAAFTLLCGTPIAAVAGTIFFAISAALVQWVAKLFGGTGTNDQLTYALAAITAPYSLISAFTGLLFAIPYVGICLGAIVAMAGIYVIILQIMAIKGVNQFGWGQAIGSFVLPGFTVGILCCVALGIGLSVLGLAFGDIWNTIRPNLTL